VSQLGKGFGGHARIPFCLRERRTMASSFRVSPTEIQVGHYLYTFEDPDDADSFLACVEAINVNYCEQKFPCINKRSIDARCEGHIHHN
jgi:hypothetical protein